MTHNHIKTAVRLFRNPLAPRSVRRHNARSWLAATHRLGDKWLLYKPMEIEFRRTQA
jgi:hypothetical protein